MNSLLPTCVINGFFKFQNLVSPNEEVITPVVSSQSSQKRKLNDEVLSQGNVSKKKSVEETLTHSFQDDSVSDSSDIPSSIGSPSFVVIVRLTKRKRMSNSDFIKVLKSDRLGQQSQVVNTSDDLGESNIPSDLGSPDKLLFRRPEDVNSGQSLSARPRMSALPPHPSSFPVGVVMNDEHVARPPPVPKPRTVHKTAGLPSESPPPKSIRASNAVEHHNDETSE